MKDDSITKPLYDRCERRRMGPRCSLLDVVARRCGATPAWSTRSVSWLALDCTSRCAPLVWCPMICHPGTLSINNRERSVGRRPLYCSGCWSALIAARSQRAQSAVIARPTLRVEPCNRRRDPWQLCGLWWSQETQRQ